MNILLIYTGGTIGSSARDGFIGTDAAQGKLLRLYLEQRSNADKCSLRFHEVTPYSILSENLDFTYFFRLLDCLTEQLALPKDTPYQTQYPYDGVIIAHGTDTLQYTAAGLSCMLCGIGIPVLLVSANYVLEDPRSNGLANFSAAVSYIEEQQPAGVYVAYQNNFIDAQTDHTAPVSIHAAQHLLRHRIYEDAVYPVSVPSSSYAGIPALYQAYRNGRYNNASNSSILSLTICPGMCYPALSEDVHGVLLQTYHAGTLPTKQDAFLRFCNDAKSKGIPIYVIGMQPSEQQYDSTKCYTGLGLTILPIASPILKYMELSLACLLE